MKSKNTQTNIEVEIISVSLRHENGSVTQQVRWWSLSETKVLGDAPTEETV